MKRSRLARSRSDSDGSPVELLKLLLIVGVLLIAASVMISCDNPAGPDPSALRSNYELWQAQHLTTYTFQQRRICFCLDEGNLRTVVVSGGQISAVMDAASGDTLAPDQWRWYHTVDELFAIIRSFRRAPVASVHVNYDPTYGYPTYLAVDPVAIIADDEYEYDSQSISAIGRR